MSSFAFSPLIVGNDGGSFLRNPIETSAAFHWLGRTILPKGWFQKSSTPSWPLRLRATMNEESQNFYEKFASTL
jgi:hypothetical protein